MEKTVLFGLKSSIAFLKINNLTRPLDDSIIIFGALKISFTKQKQQNAIIFNSHAIFLHFSKFFAQIKFFSEK